MQSLLFFQKRSGKTVAPVFDLKRRNEESPLHFNTQTGKVSFNAYVYNFLIQCIKKSNTDIPVEKKVKIICGIINKRNLVLTPKTKLFVES